MTHRDECGDRDGKATLHPASWPVPAGNQDSGQLSSTKPARGSLGRLTDSAGNFLSTLVKCCTDDPCVALETATRTAKESPLTT